MEKVCFKSDGTVETGKRIIAMLEKMGGVNANSYDGYDGWKDMYYFINGMGYICYLTLIPARYRLASLEEFDKPLPRRMLVSDDGGDWSEQTVIHIADWYCITIRDGQEKEFNRSEIIGCCMWRYCKELPTVSTEKQQMQKKLIELKTKVAEMEETIKMMK